MNRLLRSLLPLLLLGLLAGCSVYERVFHPHRLPSPDLMSKTAKAKFKASEKARHKGQVLKTEEPITGATDPNAPAGSEAKKDNKLSYSELPEGTKAKYDKQLLLKKPKLKRLRYHTYKTRPLRHTEVNRESRRLRKHSKGKDTDHDAPTPKGREDAPADDSPASAPAPAPQKKTAASKEPEAPQAPKEKKAKKAPVPKPDPTLEHSGN